MVISGFVERFVTGCYVPFGEQCYLAHRNLYFIIGRLFFSSQQLISQEILLLPLIYRKTFQEACLRKSPYDWFSEGLQATGCRPFSFPPFLPPSLGLRVIHVGSCFRARLENLLWGAEEESSSWNYCCLITCISLRERIIYFADISSPRDIAYACNMFSSVVQEDNSIKYKGYLFDIFYYDMNIFYLLNKVHYFFIMCQNIIQISTIAIIILHIFFYFY